MNRTFQPPELESPAHFMSHTFTKILSGNIILCLFERKKKNGTDFILSKWQKHQKAIVEHHFLNVWLFLFKSEKKKKNILHRLKQQLESRGGRWLQDLSFRVFSSLSKVTWHPFTLRHSFPQRPPTLQTFNQDGKHSSKKPYIHLLLLCPLSKGKSWSTERLEDSPKATLKNGCVRNESWIIQHQSLCFISLQNISSVRLSAHKGNALKKNNSVTWAL